MRGGWFFPGLKLKYYQNDAYLLAQFLEQRYQPCSGRIASIIMLPVSSFPIQMRLGFLIRGTYAWASLMPVHCSAGCIRESVLPLLPSSEYDSTRQRIKDEFLKEHHHSYCLV